MENTDLKWIKKHYGEKFSHLCRNLFPTILETEGLLTKLMSEHFLPSRELYDDLTQNDLVDSFKNYVFSLTKTEDNKAKVSLTPEEFMDKAGYILYPECQTEEDIQSFRHYYHRGSPTPEYQGGSPAIYKGEELCTFSGGRLRSNRVWFAVKKDVDKIKRQDFKNPRREDDYGVSVLSIQFSRSEPSILSIKNRYNHTVSNPDATFSNNLDNIIPGLTQAFVNHYGINLSNQNSKSFEIPGYVQANDGKFYKYNFEINNVYYCPNNTIIQNGEVKQFDKDKAIVFDYFILDLERKEIINYNIIAQRNDVFDAFSDSVGKIKDIKRVPSADGLTIQITPENGDMVEIQLNKHNEIVGYINPNVIQIGENFLRNNNTLTSINLPNATQIGENFLRNNNTLTSINLPNATQIGSYFLRNNNTLTSINLPNAIQIGDDFLLINDTLTSINLPNAIQIGDDFLRTNITLTSINLPNVIQIGDSFLCNNNTLTSINLPNVTQIGDNFLLINDTLTNINLPNATQIGDRSLCYNNTLTSINLPNVIQIGDSFLCYNNTLTSINIPNVIQIGGGFLDHNKLISEVETANGVRVLNESGKEL